MGSQQPEEGGDEPPTDSESQVHRSQGDVLSLKSIPILTTDGISETPTPDGVTIISQTCDVVLESRPNVAVAKVVTLEGPTSRQAVDGHQPRYVPLTALGPNYFADLEHIATLNKETLAMFSVTAGLDQSDIVQVRRFSLLIGRRFGRFAYPDEVVPWLEPLLKTVREKYDRPESALGRALERVVEFRVEARDWCALPLDLTLHVIVSAGTLPQLEDDEYEEPSKELGKWLRPFGDLTKSATEIADKLFSRGSKLSPSDLTPIDQYHLWLSLGEALAASCQPKTKHATDPRVAHAVSTIEGVVVADDEFTLVQYRRSEVLDLEHLSAPTPLGPAERHE